MHLPDPVTGVVPPGRFRMEMHELEGIWVDPPQFATSSTRRPIWEKWQEATAALRGAVPVAAAWVDGSFFSDKLNPGDLDCVWLIDDVQLATATMQTDRRRLISIFAGNQLRTVGIPVDSFVLPWRRRPEIASRDEFDDAYLKARGYWDDLWQRKRTGPKGAQPTRADALPRRGYLEVVLDDFPG